MNSSVLKFVVFPALAVLYRVLSPMLNEVLPVNKEVVHVRSLDETVNQNTQYPVLDFIGLVEQHGYTAEEYSVTTDDGYILQLHRISGSPSKPKAFGKPVVYLQHGIGLSSDSWVLIGPGKDLAFLLADAGYDVWLGNVRGNTYSRAHVSKDPRAADFWKFSYHDMAIHDVRMSIDRALAESGAKKLTYYGYSMGTTLSYVLLSMMPEYNGKIDLLYSVAPVVFWKHELKRLMKIVDFIFEPLSQFIAYFYFQEVLPQSALFAYIGDKFCGDDNPITQPLCVSLFANIGLDPKRLNKTALPNILAHFPAGTSVITVYHYNQNYNRNAFQAYDFGPSENMKKYGQIKPPAYNLSKIEVPVSIWYGKDDDIVNEKDVFELAKNLPNVISLNAVNNEKFNHFDFLWAKDVRELIYDKLYT